MSALESLNPFFDSALVSEMRALRLTPDLLSANSAEGVAIVASVETSIPAAAVASNPELAVVSCVDLLTERTESPSPRSLGTGQENQASFEPAPMAPATSMPLRLALDLLSATTGVETPAGDTGENIVSSPAAFSSSARESLADGRSGDQPQPFSFQPDFEKLFNTIFELTDMEAVLICADEALRLETLLGDGRHT